MDDENAATGKPEHEKKPRFNQEQYNMLMRCSEKKDVTEWNEWREKNPNEEIWLEGVNLQFAHLKNAALRRAHLEHADLSYAHLEHADLTGAHLENIDFTGAQLEHAYLNRAHLEHACLWKANLEHAVLPAAHLEHASLSEAQLEHAYLWEAQLEHADFKAASVNGETLIWDCSVDKNTDFRGVALDSIRIDAGTKELLKFNGRRMNWEDWYKKPSRYKIWRIRPFRWLYRYMYKEISVHSFWLISDYGMSTIRIIGFFLGMSFLFASLYWCCDNPPLVHNLHEIGGKIVEGNHFWRALYFSIVTMTTLGFGDMHAEPGNTVGYFVLMIQVIFGYVILGALVTRLSILFSADGPAGTFSKTYKPEAEPSNKKESSNG